MLTIDNIRKLKTLYQENKNIIQYIESNTDLDREEAILHSYDLQAGRYVKGLADKKIKTHKEEIGYKLGEILKKLSISCICEAGVGEATTLVPVLSSVEIKKKFAFDISMSSLLHGQRYLKNNNLEVDLFCAELLRIPFPDNSIECMFTFHCVESNGKKEKRVLNELLRVTKKYLILIEPDYDFFGEEQKTRMDLCGYAKHLPQHLSELGAKIIHYEPWGIDINPINKTSIIIVEKSQSKQASSDEVNFISPISGEPLMQNSEGLFCDEDGFFFPKVKNIPVLLKGSAILVSHYNHFDKADTQAGI